MSEKEEILKPLARQVFPYWECSFIDNPLLDAVQLMMRQGDRYILVRFNNEDFLLKGSTQERDAYFLSLLFNAKSEHDNPKITELEYSKPSLVLQPRILQDADHRRSIFW
jgi:hypothetical protein